MILFSHTFSSLPFILLPFSFFSTSPLPFNLSTLFHFSPNQHSPFFLVPCFPSALKKKLIIYFSVTLSLPSSLFPPSHFPFLPLFSSVPGLPAAFKKFTFQTLTSFLFSSLIFLASCVHFCCFVLPPFAAYSFSTHTLSSPILLCILLSSS